MTDVLERRLGARDEPETDLAYGSRLRYAADAVRPIEFDDASEFLRDCGFISAATPMAEVEKKVAGLNRDRSWAEYNRIVAVLEQLST